VREVGDQVLFLHRLQPGGADRSYGIEVGRLAGLPRDVLARARAVLRTLEGGHALHPRTEQPGRQEQLALFTAASDLILERLSGIDPNTLTPLRALELLAELSEEARRRG
jgi:DNA mismatch repair protein MutS